MRLSSPNYCSYHKNKFLIFYNLKLHLFFQNIKIVILLLLFFLFFYFQLKINLLLIKNRQIIKFNYLN